MSAHAACPASATARAQRTHVAAEVAERLQVGGADGDAVEGREAHVLRSAFSYGRLRRPRSLVNALTLRASSGSVAAAASAR